MNTVLTIIKKEFRRFFSDKRLIFTTILMPGLILYLCYTLIGVISSSVTADQPQSYTAYVRNMPDILSDSLSAVLDVSSQPVTDEEAKNLIAEGELDLLIIFPENFGELTPSADAPDVEIFYNSAETSSLNAFSAVTALLNAYEESIANVFDINGGDGVYDLADSTSVSMYVLSMVVPMVMIMLMLSGCISVVLESIAGEKERGTIATLLVTPVRRSHLAAGKIIALSVISVLSGLSSFLGLVLSLPNLMGGYSVEFTLAAYGALDYLGLFLVVISTVLIFVALLAIVSAYAKSTKEANGLIAPVMIVALVCSLASMFVSSPSIGLYFVPILNSSLCISSLMGGVFGIAPFLITMAVNLVCAAALSFLLGVMFNSEKIMFNK